MSDTPALYRCPAEEALLERIIPSPAYQSVTFLSLTHACCDSTWRGDRDVSKCMFCRRKVSRVVMLGDSVRSAA